MTDPRRQRELSVRIAASEERAAHRALLEGMRPGDPSWDASHDEAYRERLARWRAASQELVDALDSLHAALHPGRSELPQAGPLRTVAQRRSRDS